MVLPAQLGALAQESAGLVGHYLKTVGAARDGVHLEQERGHPEGVDDVAGREDELHPLPPGQVERRRLTGCAVLVDGLLLVVELVVEVPAPLLAHDIDLVAHPRLERFDVEQLGLVARGEEEVDEHGEQRSHRVEDFNGHVVAHLRGQPALASAASEKEAGVEDESPDQSADQEGDRPRAVPECLDPFRLLGDPLGEAKPPPLARIGSTAGQDERG